MSLNYLLLGTMGLISLFNIISLIKGRGWLGNRYFSGLLSMFVFVLVAIATIMGMDYATFRTLIEAYFI